jgi:hypothetical protein
MRGQHRQGYLVGLAREIRPTNAMLGDDLDVRVVLGDRLVEAVLR